MQGKWRMLTNLCQKGKKEATDVLIGEVPCKPIIAIKFI